MTYEPSFELLAPETIVAGSIAGTAPSQTASYILQLRFWTNRGNAMNVTRQATGLPYPLTASAAYAWAKNLATAIQAAEDAAAVPPPASVLAPYVGNRYDATQASPTILAAANTPVDTGAPPLGGG